MPYRDQIRRSASSWRSPTSPIPRGRTIPSWTGRLKGSAGVIEQVFEVQGTDGLEVHTLFWTQSGAQDPAAAAASFTVDKANVVYYLHPSEDIRPRIRQPYRPAKYGSAIMTYRTHELYDRLGALGNCATEHGRLLVLKTTYNVLGPGIHTMPPAIQANLVRQGETLQRQAEENPQQKDSKGNVVFPGWWFVTDGLFSRDEVGDPKEGEKMPGQLLETLIFEPFVVAGKIQKPEVSRPSAPTRTLQRWNSEPTASHPRGLSYLLQTSHLPGTDTKGPPTRIRLHCGGGEVRLLPAGARHTATVSPAAFSTIPNSLTDVDNYKFWTTECKAGVLSAVPSRTGDIVEQSHVTGAPPGVRDALAALSAQYEGFYGSLTRPHPHSLTWDASPEMTRARRIASRVPGEIAYDDVPLTWEWRHRPPEQGDILRNRALIQTLSANGSKEDSRKYEGRARKMSLALMRSLYARRGDPYTVVRLVHYGTMLQTRPGSSNSRYSFTPYFAPYDHTQVLHRDSLFPISSEAASGVIVPRRSGSNELSLDLLANAGFHAAAEQLEVEGDYCYDKLGEGDWRFIGGDFDTKGSAITQETETSVSRSGVMLVGWWQYQVSGASGAGGGPPDSGVIDLTAEQGSKRKRTIIDID